MPDGAAPTAYGKTSMSTEEVGLIANDFQALAKALDEACVYAEPPATAKEFGAIPEAGRNVADLMAIVGHLVESVGYAGTFVHSMSDALMQAAGLVDYTEDTNAESMKQDKPAAGA